MSEPLTSTGYELLRAREWARWYHRWNLVGALTVSASVLVYLCLVGIALISWIFHLPYPQTLQFVLAVVGALLWFGGVYWCRLISRRYLSGRQHPDELLALAEMAHKIYLREQERA